MTNRMLDRKSIIEGIGIAAVIASLLFVAFEIRQANRIAIGTTAYELNRNWMSINQLYMTDPGILELVVALTDEQFVPRDEKQREQVEAYARLLVNTWISIEDAYNNGIASDTTFAVASEDVIALVEKRPGALPAFSKVASRYDLTEYKLLTPLHAAIDDRQEDREELEQSN